MPYNLPTFETSNISLGPCVVTVGPEGVEPNIDIGAIRASASIAITRSTTDVTLGNPALLVERFANAESIEITLTSLEWDLYNWSLWALGYPLGYTNVLDFGGLPTFKKCSLKLLHRMPSGATIEMDFWRCVPSGNLTIPFSDDVHEFELTFHVMYSSEDWNGNPLSEGEQLCRIKKIE